jgi:hypothetical protein
MNREQAKELLPIFQAFAEGKTIQYQAPSGMWMDDPCFNPWAHNEVIYRIKPEKKKGWIAISREKSRDKGIICSLLYETREEAIQSMSIYNQAIACIEIEYEEGQGLD